MRRESQNEIDLSFPSIMALGTAIFCLSVTQWGLPWYVGFVLAFATGGLCGLINGITVASIYVPNGGKDFDAKMKFVASRGRSKRYFAAEDVF